MRLSYLILVPLLLVIPSGHADLRADLREFYNLIPRGRVAFLVGRHFLFDTNFRMAWNYMRSNSFEALIRDKISKNRDYKKIGQYLGYNIDLTAIPRFIRRYDIRPQPLQEYGGVRTFSSFIREVSDVLPSDRISKLIEQKSAANPQFAEFNEKVAGQQFKTLVYKARNSKSLAGAFNTMKMNQVDIDEILKLFFQKVDEWNQ